VKTTTTRRELVRSGVAAGAAASVAVGSERARAAAAPTQSDAQVLTRTLRVEQLVSIAYRRVLGSHALEPGVARLLRTPLAQELEHVAALERALGRLGASIPASPASLGSAQAALARHHVSANLTRPASQHECLKLLIDVESLAEGAYFSAISKLRDPLLLRISAEIMGCEAQHWTMLSGLQHRGKIERAVPYAFVQGSS
jgi:hypothetical protein